MTYMHIYTSSFLCISSHLHQHHLKTNIRGKCISLVDRRVGDTTCGYKAKDITPSIAWRGEAWKEEALDDRPWKDKKGQSSVEHWNCFKSNIGETSERRGGAHMGFSNRVDAILNWTELELILHINRILNVVLVAEILIRIWRDSIRFISICTGVATSGCICM